MHAIWRWCCEFINTELTYSKMVNLPFIQMGGIDALWYGCAHNKLKVNKTGSLCLGNLRTVSQWPSGAELVWAGLCCAVLG